MTQKLHPNEVMAAMLSAARHSVKRKNLEIIHEICVQRNKHGETDFSLATIAPLVEAGGGPKAKTMWNESCEDYRKLILAWQTYSGNPTFRSAVKDHPTHRLLDNISDHATRFVVEKIISERDSLQALVNILKANSRLIIDKRPSRSNTAPVAITTEGIKSEVKPPLLNLLEREALEHSISLEFWNSEGWKAEKNGRVVKELGTDRTRTVLKPGFVTAIRKILDNK